MRQWRQYETTRTGDAFVILGPRCLRVQSGVGRITSGRHCVFHGYFVAVELPDETRLVGEDRHSIIAALEALNTKLVKVGHRLLAVGLDRRFHETNQSVGTGFGLVVDLEGWFHIMDAPPYPRTERTTPTGKSFSGQITVS